MAQDYRENPQRTSTQEAHCPGPSGLGAVRCGVALPLGIMRKSRKGCIGHRTGARRTNGGRGDADRAPGPGSDGSKRPGSRRRDPRPVGDRSKRTAGEVGAIVVPPSAGHYAAFVRAPLLTRAAPQAARGPARVGRDVPLRDDVACPVSRPGRRRRPRPRPESTRRPQASYVG